MGEETYSDSGASTRLKLNDIRIVGPLLVLLMAAAVLISPGLVSADSSVGSEVNDGFDPSACYEISVKEAKARAVGSCEEEATRCPSDPLPPKPEPTVEPVDETLFAATALVEAMECPEERETVKVAPPGPIPAEIIGPIWLGAIEATEFGVVTMQFPALLATFVSPTGIVKVTDDNGTLVYEGPLSPNGTISFPTTGSDTYTVKTKLINGAKYTEVVTPS